MGEHVQVTEFRGMALNGLFCADVLLPLDLVPLTDYLQIPPCTAAVFVSTSRPGEAELDRDCVGAYALEEMGACLLSLQRSIRIT